MLEGTVHRPSAALVNPTKPVKACMHEETEKEEGDVLTANGTEI